MLIYRNLAFFKGTLFIKAVNLFPFFSAQQSVIFLSNLGFYLISISNHRICFSCVKVFLASLKILFYFVLSYKLLEFVTEMGFGKLYRSCSVNLKPGGANDEQLPLGFVQCTLGLGRKRVGISNEMEEFDSATQVPLLKRQCSERMVLTAEDYFHQKSTLELLPQDVLIRIICGVEHKDLKQLYNVSKSIREATVVAKQMHFAYSTPTKVKAFRTSIDLEEASELDEVEAPNAPRQLRSHRPVSRKKLANISVALFA